MKYNVKNILKYSEIQRKKNYYYKRPYLNVGAGGPGAGGSGLGSTLLDPCKG